MKLKMMTDNESLQVQVFNTDYFITSDGVIYNTDYEIVSDFRTINHIREEVTKGLRTAVAIMERTLIK